ncbi:hypothetical protein G7Y89_g1462 [Cudoniella acicularis]|uniref:Uncharacterized protein n=1 Tax=Cudoniella acicularis TaxID=354080 RepID=A0A8H4RWW0_9HELO|nr:hypothetical protein G7Y89_g1462 [Cudoniella acicularis]
MSLVLRNPLFYYYTWALLVSSALGALTFTNTVFTSVTAGEPFGLTWEGASGPVSIILEDGAANDLVTVATIASGLSGTSYTWNVPSTLAANTYVLQITDGSSVNYSPQFQILGAAAATSSSAAPASTSKPSSTALVASSTSTPLTTSNPSSTSPLSTSAQSSTSGASTSATSSSASSSSATNNPSSTSASTPTSPSNTSPQQTSSTSTPSSGLSTGTKAAIGVGVTFGIFLLAAIIALVFYLGRKSAKKSNFATSSILPELGGIPLTDEEKRELGRRREITELDQDGVVRSIGGGRGERAELEALRRFEMAGESVEIE